MFGKMRIWHAILLMYATGFTGIGVEFFLGATSVAWFFYLTGIAFAGIACYGMWNDNSRKKMQSNSA
jgi:hypothetical protein